MTRRAKAAPADAAPTVDYETYLKAVKLLWAVLTTNGGEMRVPLHRFAEKAGEVVFEPDGETLVITARPV